MANEAIEKLKRILRHEAQGYQDRAVTRGLGSFSPAWIADASRNGLDAAWAESIAQAMRDYSALADADARRPFLQRLLDRLQNPPEAGAQQAPPELAPSAAPPSERSARPAAQPVVAALPPSMERGESRRERAPLDRVRVQLPAASSPLAQPDRARTETPASRHQAALGLDAPVHKIAGIGPANAKLLAKLGVRTIRDLLFYFPVRYDDYSALKTINQLEYDEQVTVLGRIASAWKQRTRANLFLVRVTVEDASGGINCTWFRDERTVESLMKQLQVGREVVISGKVTEYMGRLAFQNPTFEIAEKEWITGGRIVPVYRLTEGLHPMLVRRVMKRLSEYWPARVTDYLPERVRRAANLMAQSDALREIHFPRDQRARESARRRLAFDELFTIQMAVLRQRLVWRTVAAAPLNFDELTLGRLISALPYVLTGAQRRAIDRIARDLREPVAMRRLLQGDVGSGKTVVAALAMALAASSGFQSALMAPTEILAEQHFRNLERLFGGLAEKMAITPLRIRLLTGSVKAAEKRAIYEEIGSGAAHVVVGTHALIQEGVEFRKLGFTVVDEQHRFGVEQRKALRQKGANTNPHTLFMTATPIPRTLALTMYGDLDNTVLDEMPPGRQPIDTHWFAPAERERAYSFVRAQARQGRQAFIICPLVEESDKVEAKAAVEEHARLQRDVFPDLKLGLLHGRMKGRDKEDVMGAFARGDLDVLVSTSVVEVGIDVPNATIMMIEGANRFGLSQLHQFRGRVGRGEHASFCLLLADASTDVSDQRLQAIVASQDGFKLAEKDLEIRGPGEFFGTRQSGEPELKLVGIGDRDLLEAARTQAETIYAGDPQLALPEHAGLLERIDAFWARRAAQGEADGDAS